MNKTNKWREMLMICDVETLQFKDFKINKRKTKKTQILLYDTQRRSDDFINKIKFRRNGEYENIPHFLITKTGIIYQFFDTNYSSKIFDNRKIDNQQIKIAIENLGWLNKNTINSILFNWIGDPYRTEPLIKNWRNHFYWDIYPEDQLSSIVHLCDILTEKHGIERKIVPSQGFFSNADKFKGVVCKSNFSDIYTDINPSFNFRLFFNNEENTVNQLRSDQKDVEYIKKT